ncbi:hypothetical protein GF351_03120 [Candidatus Woesearchaeota archaeon]|nr:hypothetical protein [Candidatus Woesearchaeota archaeon]
MKKQLVMSKSRTMFCLMLFAGLVLLLIPSAESADQEHMVLLAVREKADGFEGSAADLYLEIQRGRGRVFLDTYPLTKLDTQMSTRFAKEIACNHIDMDCSAHDFIYTITADSAIVGGPSAGAASAVLAVALLEDIRIDERTSITGTVNSGGVIGPVGGLKAKIDAARQRNITKVLIPKGERFVRPEINLTSLNSTNLTAADILQRNKSLDLVEYGERIGIQIVEVATLDDALYQFSGKRIRDHEMDLEISEGYKDTMRQLAEQLCGKTNQLVKEYNDLKLNLTRMKEQNLSVIEDQINNLSTKSSQAFEEQRYYSSASYCFGANVKARYSIYSLLDLSEERFVYISKLIEGRIEDFPEMEYQTITDLEASMIVRERLIDAKTSLKKAREDHDDNLTDSAFYNLAYASERLESADSWTAFLDHRGKQFVMDRSLIKKGCISKLSEAEERVQYVKLLFSESIIKETSRTLQKAYEDLDNHDYELCLFKASKAKAEADVIVGAAGVEDDQVKDFIRQKISIAETMIIRQQQKSVFPVLAYSYYEYAQDLVEADPFSSLLYAEYAIELSNLDLYFEAKDKGLRISMDPEHVLMLSLGFGIGILFSLFFTKPGKSKRSKPGKKSRSR